jgi:hypothetical protein
VRKMRNAISPLLATNIFFIMALLVFKVEN